MTPAYVTSTLHDMCELVVDCPHFTPEWTKRGFVVIRNQNIRNGRLNLDDRRYTHKKDFLRRIRRAKPREGDIIFTREAPMGEVCRVPEGLECCLGQRQVLLRPRPELSGEYLLYALQSPLVQDQILWNEGTGSTVSNVRIPVLKALNIPRRPDEEAIAVLLRALDDKIDLNRRMNETLESMARAIFKDWFVDFGPTRAKAEGGEPYLAPELWNLFPDNLDDADKPEGWRHWTIADLAVQHRATVAPFENPEQEFEHFSIPAFDAGQYPVLDNGASIKSRKTAIPANVVLLSKLNPNIPRVWIPNPPNGLPQVASTEFLALAPKSPATCSLLYCLFRDAQFRREMEAMVTGTSKSHQRVSPKALVRRRVLAGASDAFEQFDRQASSLLSRVLRNRVEARTLAQTRDILLPKLMSGEIRLSEAENTVEAVT